MNRKPVEYRHGEHRKVNRNMSGLGIKNYKLSVIQQEFLDYLENYKELHGHSPDMIRIGRDYGLAKLSVRSKLLTLFLKGAIRMGEPHYESNKWYNFVVVKGSTFQNKLIKNEVIQCETLPQDLRKGKKK